MLGRGEFVIALANAFIQWRGEASLVVALYGPWGSGKSSVKNMVLEAIKRHDPRPAIVEFNPWSWSGQDRLLSAFFDEVGAAIGKQSETPEARDMAAKWRKYASRLSFAGSVITAIKVGTQAVGVPLVPIVLEGLAGGAKQVSEVAESAKKTYEATGEEEPLDRIKGILSESLSGMDVPLLVVMDDVDRLTNEEIRLLFQVIKVNADFPKVVYLLLFDRSIVEKALQGFGGASGRDYLEKIVQAGFELPKVDRSDLDRMFLSGLTQILSFEGANRTFDSERWPRLYIYGLKPILKTPRHVRRFLSAFSFTVGLFYREQTLEVNVIDLIAIEALRIFEPDLYHKLPERKGLLLGEMASSLLRGDVKEDHKREFERLIEVVVEEDRAAVTAIVQELFPPIDWLLKGFERGRGFEGGWLREIRICHKDLFDRYFALLVPKGDVPQSWIDRLIGVAGDRTAMLEELSRLRESGRLDQAMSRLESYASEIDMGVALPFVTALMDIGDSLQRHGPSLFDIRPDMTTYFIIYNYLTREKDSKARGRILIGAIQATEGLFLPVKVVSTDLASH